MSDKWPCADVRCWDRDLAQQKQIEQLEIKVKDQKAKQATCVVELAAMKQERDEAEWREKQWEHDYATDLKAAHAERDGQAMQIDALRTHLSATITEKDRLKEALSMTEAFLLQNKNIGLLWNGPQELALSTIQAALRGTQEP